MSERDRLAEVIASALRLAATSAQLPPTREPLPFLSLARVAADAVLADQVRAIR
jgi:hypothetical protein